MSPRSRHGLVYSLSLPPCTLTHLVRSFPSVVFPYLPCHGCNGEELEDEILISRGFTVCMAMGEVEDTEAGK